MESTYKQHYWVRTAGCESYEKDAIVKHLSTFSTFRAPVDAVYS